MRNVFALMLGVLLVGSGWGCGVVKAVREGIVEPPTAEVLGVTVVDATDRGVSVEALVLLRNPNAVELPVESVRVVFAGSGGERFASESPATVSMPPNGEQRMTVRGALPLRGGAGGLESEYTARVSVRWVPPGEVRSILTESGVPLPVVVASGE